MIKLQLYCVLLSKQARTRMRAMNWDTLSFKNFGGNISGTIFWIKCHNFRYYQVYKVLLHVNNSSGPDPCQQGILTICRTIIWRRKNLFKLPIKDIDFQEIILLMCLLYKILYNSFYLFRKAPIPLNKKIYHFPLMII